MRQQLPSRRMAIAVVAGIGAGLVAAVVWSLVADGDAIPSGGSVVGLLTGVAATMVALRRYS